MKMTLDWHIKCLENQERTLSQLRDRADRAQKEFFEMSARYSDYRRQIERAQLEGRDGFDADRFNIQNRSKS